MFDEMTRSNGKPWSGSASLLRYSSALIASSPLTAYSTLRMAGLRESAVRGRMVVALDEMDREQMAVNEEDALR